ncbi:MAG: hypothetical protein RJA70_1901 [Pseudomonadota bacterium]
MTAPAIAVDHVSQLFGETLALSDVSLTVDRGEVAVIIGASGAGKTSLLRIMVGLDKPTSGRVLIDGEDIVPLNERQLSRLRRKFGMVFQYSALLDSLTVLDNVGLPLREHTTLSGQEIEAKVQATLVRLELPGILDRFPSELSGGMRKRVGLARALVLEPQILMYDEPTSGLDPLTARLVDDLILKTRDDFGVASVIISHDMVQAHKIADQVHVLDQGKLVASGTPAALFEDTAGLAQRFFSASIIPMPRSDASRHPAVGTT